MNGLSWGKGNNLNQSEALDYLMQWDFTAKEAFSKDSKNKYNAVYESYKAFSLEFHQNFEAIQPVAEGPGL